VAKIDRIKEEIGWLKVVFGILVATDISLLAWLAENFASAPGVQAVVSLVAVVVVTGAIVWVNHLAYVRIKQLEDL
jgi:4-hydroxybenzoate polyprenyltransferase